MLCVFIFFALGFGMSNQATELANQLASDDVAQAHSAAETLATLGEEAAPAAVALVRAAGHADERVCEQAVAALEELGRPAAGDVDALSGLLRAEQSDVGYWAATLLGRLGEDAAASCQALAQVLDDAEAELAVRERAAWALSRIGLPASVVGESLKRAAASSDARLARLASAALENIGDS
jgi:hypothetical protein